MPKAVKTVARAARRRATVPSNRTSSEGSEGGQSPAAPAEVVDDEQQADAEAEEFDVKCALALVEAEAAQHRATPSL